VITIMLSHLGIASPLDCTLNVARHVAVTAELPSRTLRQNPPKFCPLKTARTRRAKVRTVKTGSLKICTMFRSSWQMRSIAAKPPLHARIVEQHRATNAILTQTPIREHAGARLASWRGDDAVRCGNERE
jgi:hypothetical protein